ncbi:MAG: hypothetical protein ACTIJY_06610 [Luteimonas sp.]
MKMRFVWRSMLVSVAVLAFSSVSAQEMSFRSGLITGISPLQVAAAAAGQQQAAPSRTSGAFGRALGRMAGRAASRVTGEYSYEAYEVASGAARDVMDGAVAAPAGGQTVTAYMVMMRFDDGSETAIQAANVAGLNVGSRARVFGSGASARIVPE